MFQVKKCLRWAPKTRLTRSVKNFVRRARFYSFDVHWKFFIVRGKFFTLKTLLKGTKIRSAYKMFHATCKQNLTAPNVLLKK